MEARSCVALVLVLAQALACDESSTSDRRPGDPVGSAGALDGGGMGGAPATGAAGSGISASASGAGATGGSMSPGGSSSAAAGSPGENGSGASNYGNALPSDPRCTLFAARVADACPGEWTRASSHHWCQEALNELYPIGCDAEFGELLACEGDIDCRVGYAPGCADAYRTCRNDFLQETACLREGAKVTCPEGRYAFVCRGASPPACTPTQTLGSGVRACCPPFD